MTRAAVFIIVSSLLFSTACGGDSTPDTAPAKTAAAEAKDAPHADDTVVRIDPTMLRDLRITTAAVESRAGGEAVNLLGELSVDERSYAEIGVPVASRAIRLLAAPGDSVKEGQVLMDLQSPEIGRARSDYLSAQARAGLANAALERKRDLAKERIVPAREVQEAEAAAGEAAAAVRAASAALTSLGLTPPGPDEQGSPAYVLRTPVAGTVIERNVMRGQMIDPATPVFRVGDLSTLWLTVHAFERDAVRIRAGTQARVSFSALPGESHGGRVSLVGRAVAKDSRTVPVRIDVANRNGVLRPGMSATAAVPVGTSSTPVLTVPVAAVQRVREAWCVFVPKNNSTYEIRKIGRGRDLGGEVEVLSGLSAGERIVVDGAFLLKAQAEKGQGGHGGQP